MILSLAFIAIVPIILHETSELFNFVKLGFGKRAALFYSEGKGENFTKRLHQIADHNKVIILALVDQGYTDVAMNFWELSIQPFDITNMLFVSLSSNACHILTSAAIPCHVFEDFTGGTNDSVYMSPVFLKKMNIRTLAVLDALSHNFTVLNTDSDMIFFRNPLQYLTCNDCDFEFLEDGTHGYINAGFMYIRSSPITGIVL